MTYEEALAESRAVGASNASDSVLMAMFCESTLQTLVGAVSPKLVWMGAQKKEISTKELAALCSDPMAVDALMWL
ncbi:hypothetical protein ACFVYT_39000 [Streptomyces sp. NPDC058290]|uniref:hypothetical protein n=1 Tax=Streptomyces sp. NPDC058290 TaxID=3346426 RepID=UPI0036E86A8F